MMKSAYMYGIAVKVRAKILLQWFGRAQIEADILLHQRIENKARRHDV